MYISDDYGVDFLLDYIDEVGVCPGNPDIFRKSLYENYYYRKFYGSNIPKQSTYFSGALWLEHERIDDVYFMKSKSFKSYAVDFVNLEIYQTFGINLKEYLEMCPKDIAILNEVATTKKKETSRHLEQELKNLT